MVALYFAAVEDSDVRQYVGVHESRGPARLRQTNHRRGDQSSELQGQVRISSGVDDERLPQPASALQHDESGREPRRQGIRDSHASRLAAEVNRAPQYNRPHNRAPQFSLFEVNRKVFLVT